MKATYPASPERGPKTPIEDAMYPMYSHCVFNLNPRACSIDTPLHTFVPAQHVDHLHPNAVIAIAASVNQERLSREIYGDDVIYVPWQRPGFDIGLMIEQLIAGNPQREGRPARPPRHELVEPTTTRPATRRRSRSSTARRATSRRATRAIARSAGNSTPPSTPTRRETRARRDSAVAARAGLGREAVRRHGPGRRADAALRQQRATGRAWPSSARRAPTTSCARRSSRSSSTGIRPATTSNR